MTIIFWANEENARWASDTEVQPFVSGLDSSQHHFFCIRDSETCWQMGEMFK